MWFIKICPVCGKPYKGYSAISRKDGINEVFLDCGFDEAIKYTIVNYNISDVKDKEKSH